MKQHYNVLDIRFFDYKPEKWLNPLVRDNIKYLLTMAQAAIFNGKDEQKIVPILISHFEHLYFLSQEEFAVMLELALPHITKLGRYLNSDANIVGKYVLSMDELKERTVKYSHDFFDSQEKQPELFGTELEYYHMPEWYKIGIFS